MTLPSQRPGQGGRAQFWCCLVAFPLRRLTVGKAALQIRSRLAEGFEILEAPRRAPLAPRFAGHLAHRGVGLGRVRRDLRLAARGHLYELGGGETLLCAWGRGRATPSPLPLPEEARGQSPVRASAEPEEQLAELGFRPSREPLWSPRGRSSPAWRSHPPKPVRRCQPRPRSAAAGAVLAGDKVFYASTGDIHGPGHMGIYSACGVERFTYHYYPTATSILGENELSWGSDGWPVVGPESTTPLVPCGGTGGAGGSTGRDAGADAAVRADAGRAGRDPLRGSFQTQLLPPCVSCSVYKAQSAIEPLKIARRSVP
jgi:hypothetical protein